MLGGKKGEWGREGASRKTIFRYQLLLQVTIMIEKKSVLCKANIRNLLTSWFQQLFSPRHNKHEDLRNKKIRKIEIEDRSWLEQYKQNSRLKWPQHEKKMFDKKMVKNISYMWIYMHVCFMCVRTYVRTNWINMAPVSFFLRVYFRVAVHLWGRGEQHTRLKNK